MEFIGRIKELLPQRSGTSQRTGNDWVAQPFIFEYFENETDRYPDSIKLETFDAKKIENLEEGIEVRCGWSNSVRKYQRRDGGEDYMNDHRVYKLEFVTNATATADPQPSTASQPAQPPTEAKEDNDELPF